MCILGVLPGRAEDASRGPKMEFLCGRFLRLGVIPKDELTQLKVSFRNVGTDTLAILSVKGDCNCISGRYDGETVAPGHNGEVSVTVNPTHKTYYGVHSNFIRVRTNGDDGPVPVELVVEYTLVAPEEESDLL